MKSSTTEEEKSEERVDTRHLEANNVSAISTLLPHLRYAKSREPTRKSTLANISQQTN